jgi:hypothetical protein
VIHPKFCSVWKVSVFDVLRKLGDYNIPFDGSSWPRKIRPIEIEHVEKNVGKDKGYADDVNRPPENRAMIEAKIG